MQLYYQTIMDGYKLSYTFPVPATRDYYRQKPDQYIYAPPAVHEPITTAI